MPARSATDSIGEHEVTKPCRACTDFKTWFKTTSKANKPNTRQDCPLMRDELGNHTWGFLHTMAAYYPDKPSKQEQSDMKTFFTIFSNIYPCSHCAEDLRKDMKTNPIRTNSSMELSQWLCEIHNTVNVKLGKPKFDCFRVNERWKDGWIDGSCD